MDTSHFSHTPSLATRLADKAVLSDSSFRVLSKVQIKFREAAILTVCWQIVWFSCQCHYTSCRIILVLLHNVIQRLMLLCRVILVSVGKLLVCVS